MARAKLPKLKESAACVLPPVVHEPIVVQRPKKDAATRHRENEEALIGIKNKIYGESMRVLGEHLRASEVNPELASNPEKDPFFQRLLAEANGDREEAHRIYRVAAAGWLSNGESPTFVKTATLMAIGILKANAAEKGGAHVLNVGKVIVAANAIPKYPEIEVK